MVREFAQDTDALLQPKVSQRKGRNTGNEYSRSPVIAKYMTEVIDRAFQP
jgi:hypothetical protein